MALLPHVGVILMSLSKVGSWYQSAIPRVFTAQHYVNALTYDVTLAIGRQQRLLRQHEHGGGHHSGRLHRIPDRAVEAAEDS